MMMGGSSTCHGGRVHKRILSDQQKRRDLALRRQNESRRNLQQFARQLASAFVPAHQDAAVPSVLADATPQLAEMGDTGNLLVEMGDKGIEDEEVESKKGDGDEEGQSKQDGNVGLLEGTKLKGAKAREWFAQQLMLPEWMVDIPLRLRKDWYVMARPAGKRCIVVSSHGTTVSRLRNGHVLHCFPSALPNGARARGIAASSHVYCILDCIFHEPDQTYYITDMICWRGYSLYDCNFEFRYFWMSSKLAETGAFAAPSTYHRHRFSVVPIYECDVTGLQIAYNGPVPFERDGLLFYNRHAHYVLGLTPLALLWKDASCSQYFIDTDSKGNVPTYQQVVLKLQENGTVATSDDPPVILGSMPQQFLHENNKHLKPGILLRFAIGDEGLRIADGRPVAADIHYQGIANRSRSGADSSTKILFQYSARHSPLTISDLAAAIESSDEEGDTNMAFE